MYAPDLWISNFCNKKVGQYSLMGRGGGTGSMAARDRNTPELTTRI
jgi:hypothetical protein